MNVKSLMTVFCLTGAGVAMCGQTEREMQDNPATAINCLETSVQGTKNNMRMVFANKCHVPVNYEVCAMGIDALVATIRTSGGSACKKGEASTNNIMHTFPVTNDPKDVTPPYSIMLCYAPRVPVLIGNQPACLKP